MKKTWTTPELIVYGPVQELTQKTIGLGDAIVFDSSDDGGDNNDNGPSGSSL